MDYLSALFGKGLYAFARISEFLTILATDWARPVL